MLSSPRSITPPRAKLVDAAPKARSKAWHDDQPWVTPAMIGKRLFSLSGCFSGAPSWTVRAIQMSSSEGRIGRSDMGLSSHAVKTPLRHVSIASPPAA